MCILILTGTVAISYDKDKDGNPTSDGNTNSKGGGKHLLADPLSIKCVELFVLFDSFCAVFL